MVDQVQTLGIYTQKKKLARSVSSQQRQKAGGKDNARKQNRKGQGSNKSKTPSSFIERSIWETISAEAAKSCPSSQIPEDFELHLRVLI